MGLPCTPGSCGANEQAVETYLANFRTSMVGFLGPVIANKNNGGFLQSCFVHVVEDIDHSWNGVIVNNQTQAQTFAAWLEGSSTMSRVAVDGVWGSNPTC
jgi:hypothetical protein